MLANYQKLNVFICDKHGDGGSEITLSAIITIIIIKMIMIIMIIMII